MTAIRSGRRNSGLLCLLIVASIGCGDSTSDAVSGAASPVSGTAGASAQGRGPRLMIVTNGNSDWWSAVEKGMNDAAKEVWGPGGDAPKYRCRARRTDPPPRGRPEPAGRSRRGGLGPRSRFAGNRG